MVSGVVAEIKSIEYWWGNRPEPDLGAIDFEGTVAVFVGEKGGDDGAEQFEVYVCSPNRLAERYAQDWDNVLVAEDLEVLPGGKVAPITGVWVMRAWSHQDFEQALERVVRGFSPAPDFGTLAARISRLMPWDYDYRYDESANKAAGLPPAPGWLRP